MSDVTSRDSDDGKGHIVLSRYGVNEQVLSTLSYQYPLKLISPRGLGQPCTSVFMMSYGGGVQTGINSAEKHAQAGPDHVGNSFALGLN